MIVSEPSKFPDRTRSYQVRWWDFTDKVLFWTEATIQYSDCFAPTDHAIVSGWGSTGYLAGRSSTLQKAVLSIKDTSICQQQCTRSVVTEDTICAGGRGKSSCRGDSGGPLTCKDPSGEPYICGIATLRFSCEWQFSSTNSKPAVFVDVRKYYGWIKKHMRVWGQHHWSELRKHKYAITCHAAINFSFYNVLKILYGESAWMVLVVNVGLGNSNVKRARFAYHPALDVMESLIAIPLRTTRMRQTVLWWTAIRDDLLAKTRESVLTRGMSVMGRTTVGIILMNLIVFEYHSLSVHNLSLKSSSFNNLTSCNLRNKSLSNPIRCSVHSYC